MGQWTKILAIYIGAAVFATAALANHGAVKNPCKKQLSYSEIYTEIIHPRCTMCHTGKDSPRGIDLSSFAKLMSSDVVVKKKPSQSRLYRAVKSGMMPYEGSTLTPSQVKAIRKWILAGADETTQFMVGKCLHAQRSGKCYCSKDCECNPGLAGISRKGTNGV